MRVFKIRVIFKKVVSKGCCKESSATIKIKCCHISPFKCSKVYAHTEYYNHKHTIRYKTVSSNHPTPRVYKKKAETRTTSSSISRSEFIIHLMQFQSCVPPIPTMVGKKRFLLEPDLQLQDYCAKCCVNGLGNCNRDLCDPTGRQLLPGIYKYITRTRPCIIQQYFWAVKMFIFR